jgi:hypothetical protein
MPDLFIAFAFGFVLAGVCAAWITMSARDGGFSSIPKDFHLLFREKLARHEWAHIAIMPSLAPDLEESVRSFISNEKLSVSTTRLHAASIPLTAWIFDASIPSECIVEIFEIATNRK